MAFIRRGLDGDETMIDIVLNPEDLILAGAFAWLTIQSVFA